MPVTNYIWDEVNDTLLMEMDEVGNTVAAYTYEPGQYGPLISQHRNGRTRYHHYDGQGSTRALTDESGTVTDTYTYTAFGEPVVSSEATRNPFRYKGALGYHANPGAEVIYAKHNWYQPVLARWLTFVPSPSHAYANSDADSAPYCRVELTCVGLYLGFVKHCGLEVHEGTGVTRYHTPFGDKCKFTNGRVEPPGNPWPYQTYSSWVDPTGQLCACIHSKVATLNAANLDYMATPFNQVYYEAGTCRSLQLCNSNYSTHCVMKSCGIDFLGGGFLAPGWDFRLKTCTKYNITYTPQGCNHCDCQRWKVSDGLWCADAPWLPRIEPQPGPYPRDPLQGVVTLARIP